jgi:hypothetical protein
MAQEMLAQLVVLVLSLLLVVLLYFMLVEVDLRQ